MHTLPRHPNAFIKCKQRAIIFDNWFPCSLQVHEMPYRCYRSLGRVTKQVTSRTTQVLGQKRRKEIWNISDYVQVQSDRCWTLGKEAQVFSEVQVKLKGQIQVVCKLRWQRRAIQRRGGGSLEIANSKSKQDKIKSMQVQGASVEDENEEVSEGRKRVRKQRKGIGIQEEE